MAAQTARRLSLLGPVGYAILDTYPAGGSPTDPRTQLASLAYYYLLADPQRTFVMFNGGFEPSSGWSRHWTDAVKFDVGKPRGTWSVFAQGKDPERPYLDYKVYQRGYDRALVLYKPLSYTQRPDRDDGRRDGDGAQAERELPRAAGGWDARPGGELRAAAERRGGDYGAGVGGSAHPQPGRTS